MPLSGGYYYPSVSSQTNSAESSDVAATSLSSSGNATVGGALSVTGVTTVTALTASSLRVPAGNVVLGSGQLQLSAPTGSIVISTAAQVTAGEIELQRTTGDALRMITNTHMRASSGSRMGWSSGNGASVVADTALMRQSASVLKVTDGTSAQNLGALLVGTGSYSQFSASATASLQIGQPSTGFTLVTSGTVGFASNGVPAFKMSALSSDAIFTNTAADAYSAGFRFNTGRFGGYLALVVNNSSGVIAISGMGAANAITTAGFSSVPAAALQYQGLNATGGWERFHSTTQLASAMTGATVTLAGAIPAGSVVLGVATRVVTLVTGATSYSVGDGTNATAFGANIAVAATTTSNNSNWTITSVPVYAAATSIVLTANGSNFTAGAVRVDVYYATCNPSNS